jgi:hypothetical protein
VLAGCSTKPPPTICVAQRRGAGPSAPRFDTRCVAGASTPRRSPIAPYDDLEEERGMQTETAQILPGAAMNGTTSGRPTGPQSTMRAIVHERYGRPHVLEQREVDKPPLNAPAREGSARVEAVQSFVRGSGGRVGGCSHRPPDPTRSRERPAGAEGPDQRRLGRRRHLRRADRECARGRGNGRLQHRERGAGASSGSRPRRRLHPGGLHEAWTAPRPDAGHRRQPLLPRLPARPDSGGGVRPDRRTDDGIAGSDPCLTLPERS